jgi:hypothetical protein
VLTGCAWKRKLVTLAVIVIVVLAPVLVGIIEASGAK